jgi:hypothetical protein
MGELTDAKRLRLGVAIAVIILAVGIEKVAGLGWAIVIAACAVGFVAGVAVLGNRLGARRASGN